MRASAKLRGLYFFDIILRHLILQGYFDILLNVNSYTDIHGGNPLSTIALYIVALVALVLSLTKDRKKTRMAMKKAMKSLNNILPQFFTVLMLIALILALFDAELISRLMGDRSGFAGILGAALLGSISLIPGFVAFPAAAELLKNGAGIAQLAAFISSLMMVGIVTLPMESQFFGRRVALMRNFLAFLYAFGAAAFVAWGVSL